MSLVKATPEKIVFRNRPWGLFALLAGLFAPALWAALVPFEGRALDPAPYAIAAAVFFVALLVVLDAILRPTGMEADAGAGTVTIIRGRRLGRERISFPLDEVAGVVCRRREISDREGNRSQTWLALQTHRGDMKGEHRVAAQAPFSNICVAAGQLDGWIAAAHENRRKDPAHTENRH